MQAKPREPVRVTNVGADITNSNRKTFGKIKNKIEPEIREDVYKNHFQAELSIYDNNKMME